MGRFLGVFWVVGFASFFQKKSWACPGHVVFCFDSKKKTGACSGRVPGVLFFALILKKNWGMFWACSGRVVFCFDF